MQTQEDVRYDKIYTLIDPNNAAVPVEKDARVVRSKLYDYGCAADDTRITGIPHVSMCLEGTEGPFFTTPVSNLKEVVCLLPQD